MKARVEADKGLIRLGCIPCEYAKAQSCRKGRGWDYGPEIELTKWPQSGSATQGILAHSGMLLKETRMSSVN